MAKNILLGVFVWLGLYMEGLLADVKPVWSPAKEVQSAKAVLPLPGKNQSVTTTFLNPFTGTPKLGISMDHLQTTNTLFITYSFYLSGSITQTSTQYKFNLIVNLSSNITSLSYRYIAIDPSFPYQLDITNNIGPLSGGTTTGNATTSITFIYPSNYKFIFFLTCVSFNNSGTAIPKIIPQVNISTGTKNFMLNVSVGSNSQINYLHYTIIVYNYYQITNSKRYQIGTDNIKCNGSIGCQNSFPSQYENYTIIGVNSINASSKTDLLWFNIFFGTMSNHNNQFGLIMSPSPINTYSYNIIYNITYFYMMGCYCPNFGYFLDAINQNCFDCTNIHNCLQCNSTTNCTQCRLGYHLTPQNPTTTTCQRIHCTPYNQALCNCPIPGCILCSDDNTQCIQCDISNNYTIVANGTCILCTPSTQGILICQFLQLTIQQLDKQGCNGFLAKIPMQPQVYQSITSEIQIINPGITITSLTYNPTYQLATISITYTRSILNQLIILQISPIQNLTFIYQPFILPSYYSPTQCSTVDLIQNIVFYSQIVSYITLILALFSIKIVGLQLFGLLQLVYFSLSAYQPTINTYLVPFKNFHIFNGYNRIFINQNINVNISLPPAMLFMGISSSFINNINIMLILMGGYFGIVGLVYIIASRVHRPKLRQYSEYFIKQGMLTFVIFNSINIAFSAGVHCRYAQTTNPYYIFSTFVLCLAMLAILVVLILMPFTNEISYGQFKAKFKRSWQCRSFIAFTLIYRVFLGFYLGYQSEYLYCTVILLGFCILFLLAFVINLPFLDTVQNYRSGLCHFSMMVCVVTVGYYRTMKSNMSPQLKSHIHTPIIIQLILICLCITFSAILLAYYFFINTKTNLLKKKITSNQPDHHKQLYFVDMKGTEATFQF